MGPKSRARIANKFSVELNGIVVQIISSNLEEYYANQDKLWQKIGTELMERTGETCPWKEIRNHFKRHIIFHLNSYTGDLETINRLQYPYLQKLHKVHIHFTDNGPTPLNAASVMHNKLFIKYIMDGRYDSDVHEAFKRCSSSAVKKIISINVKDPAYALTEAVQKYLLKVKKPADAISRECMKPPESVEREAPNDVTTVSQSTNVSPLQPSPVMLDGIPVDIENCSAPSTFSPRDLLENESLSVNTQQFKEILLQFSPTRNTLPIEEVILGNSVSQDVTVRFQFSQPDPLESTMEIIHGIRLENTITTQMSESVVPRRQSNSENVSILENNSTGRNSDRAISFNIAPTSCDNPFRNTAKESISESYFANISTPDHNTPEESTTNRCSTKISIPDYLRLSDDEMNEDGEEAPVITPPVEAPHNTPEESTTNRCLTNISIPDYLRLSDDEMNEDGEEAPVITPPVEAPHNTPEESTTNRCLAKISIPDYLRLSDDEMNEDGEEAPVITPSFKPKEVNHLPAVDQTANDAVDTNADSIPLASRDPTTCVVSIHNTPEESTTNRCLTKISIPDYLRLSDDEMNEDGEEAPVITPSYKPKKVNHLPAVDQTANDAVDTNANSIPSASGDPTTCVVSIHNTPEESTTNRCLAKISIPDYLRLSDDEMNEDSEEAPVITPPVETPHNTPEESTTNRCLTKILIPDYLRLSDDEMNEDGEEAPVITPSFKPKEVNHLPAVDQTAKDAVDTNADSIPLTSRDPTTCVVSIHNTPEESTTNRCLAKISIPDYLRLSDDEMNEDGEEAPVITPSFKPKEVNHLPAVDQTAKDAVDTNADSIPLTSRDPATCVVSIHNTPEESTTNRCLTKNSIPDYLRLSDDEMNEDGEEAPVITPSYKPKKVNHLPAVDQTANDAVDTNANSVPSTSGDPTTCIVSIHNTPEESTTNRCLAKISIPDYLRLSDDEMNEDGEEAPIITPPVEAPHNTPEESTTNRCLTNISIPDYLRLSDDEMNEDGEEAPVITPSSKPKEVNDLPAVDQTANDAVDTNADSIPLASRDSTTCVVSIHNTPEESTTNRCLAKISIPDYLRLSDDEMNEDDEEAPVITPPVEAPHNTPEESTTNRCLAKISIPDYLRLSDDEINEDGEEAPVITPSFKPKEVNDLPAVDQTAKDAVDTNADSIPLASRDPTTCVVSIHNTPEESTSNCSLGNISVPDHLLALSEDEMNENNEEELSIANSGRAPRNDM